MLFGFYSFPFQTNYRILQIILSQGGEKKNVFFVNLSFNIFGHSSGTGALAPRGRSLSAALVKIRNPDELKKKTKLENTTVSFQKSENLN